MLLSFLTLLKAIYNHYIPHGIHISIIIFYKYKLLIYLNADILNKNKQANLSLVKFKIFIPIKIVMLKK